MQNNEEFYRTMRTGPGAEERVAFALNDDNDFFRSVDRSEKVEIPQSLELRVLHQIHHVKMAGHLGIRRRYKFLPRSFSWPNVSVNCYEIVQDYVSFAKNGF